MSGQIDARLRGLGFELPPAPEAVGSYVPVLRTGNLVVTSGQLPWVGKEMAFAGKIGVDLQESDGVNAARLCALNALSQIKACIGDLDKVKQVVRLEGIVHSAPGFLAQPQVLNGASEFFVDVFGEKGKHTRSAIGVTEMPVNASVQLSVWVEVED